MITEKQQAAAAKRFAEKWQGRGYEKGDSQTFWLELLTEVFGVADPSTFIRFEEQVKVDKTNFIDAHIPSTRTLIEQKSLGKDLRKGIVQSDGSVLNPFQQAKRYVANMPLSEHPRWIVTCNFEQFLVYDMEQPNGEPEQILLKNLGKEYYRLHFLVDAKSEHLTKEMEVSMKAGEIVGRIYDALLRQYMPANIAPSAEVLRWLNILCVRIVFCLYAEDAGVFSRDQFHDYLATYEAKDLRRALLVLFETLKTPADKRSHYLQDDLKAFPYTNGGLFEEETEIPQFTEELKQLLLQNASLDFDWSEISPTIFGAVFESTLNPETRRSGGMHYTSIENIHKLIDPLFLNDLRRELDDILEEKVERQRNKRLDAFQDKLASLTFLDPACGSGNFLTETYLSLRRLENEVIRERHHGQTLMGAMVNPVKVNINQFYGIEINDFAVTVATTALWISEAQMLAETERIIHQDIDFLPLKTYHNIREGNALRMDWQIGTDASERREAIGTDASERRKAKHIPFTTLQFLQRNSFVNIRGAQLPHWHQNDKVQFVSFRLADSLPQQKLAELKSYKEQWLSEHPEPWDKTTKEAYYHEVHEKTDHWLDQGYGECILGREDIRNIVAEALLFYHGKRYILHHFVIMPNHVHLLLSPIGDDEITKSIGSVKQYTANAINKKTGRSGEVWQRNIFDHMVRDAQKYEEYVNYINTNPRNLLPDQYTLGTDASERWGEDDSDARKRRLLMPDYIIGNPPFIGARLMSESQKQDMTDIFGAKWKNVGNMDYVCCWYKKAADMMKLHRQTRAALVSTNSICQGEQVANLWKPLFEEGIHIDFAHRTFRWDSESSLKAHVHCVIVGFSIGTDASERRGEDDSDARKRRLLFDGERIIKATNINAYLMDALDVFVESRQRPLAEVPEIGIGNKPIDGGNYLFTKEEMEDFIRLEPKAGAYFKPWYGSEEFIHQRPRYCLWLGNCSPAELRQMPHCMKRIEAVKDMRLSSKSAGTRKLALTPTRFHVENMPEGSFIIIPRVSSERRRYVPMGFMSPDTLASDSTHIIPDATLFHFGVLTSNVHMAWMRAVCGRLEMRYRYSKDIVYNNFPWPDLGTDASERRGEDDSDARKRRLLQDDSDTRKRRLLQDDSDAGKRRLLQDDSDARKRRLLRERIEQTAQGILDARALYPDSSLADLYDELTMPAELRRAHQMNDRAVMEAYGFPVKSTFTENLCVAELFKMYDKLVKEKGL